MSVTKDKSKKNWAEVTGKKHQEELDDKSAKSEEAPLALEYPSQEELEQKLTETEQAVEKYRNDYLRAQAEMQNILRRSKLDVENAHKFATEKFVRELVEVVANLERALTALGTLPAQYNQLKTGIELTYKMFLDVLGKYGVKQINPEGEVFNPTYHEAMSLQESKDFPPNSIIKILQKGYTLHDRLIRPAMVIVSK